MLTSVIDKFSVKDIIDFGIPIPESLNIDDTVMMEDLVIFKLNHKKIGPMIRFTLREYEKKCNKWFCWNGEHCTRSHCRYIHKYNGVGYSASQLTDLNKVSQLYLDKKCEYRKKRNHNIAISVPRINKRRMLFHIDNDQHIEESISKEKAINIIWNLDEHTQRKLLLDITYRHFDKIKDSFDIIQ